MFSPLRLMFKKKKWFLIWKWLEHLTTEGNFRLPTTAETRVSILSLQRHQNRWNQRLFIWLLWFIFSGCRLPVFYCIFFLGQHWLQPTLQVGLFTNYVRPPLLAFNVSILFTYISAKNGGVDPHPPCQPKIWNWFAPPPPLVRINWKFVYPSSPLCQKSYFFNSN